MNTKSLLIYQTGVAAFLALSITLERKIDFTGSILSVYPDNYLEAFEWADIAWFFGLFMVSWFALELVKRLALKVTPLRPKKSGKPKNNIKATSAQDAAQEPGASSHTYRAFLAHNKRAALLSFLLLFLCWFLVFLNYYPGTSMNDQLGIIENPWRLFNVHPVVYSLLLSGFVNLGIVLGSASAGMAAYVIAQMIFCSLIVVACVFWLAYRGAPKFVALLVLACFCLVPVFSNYAINTIKDTPFAYVMLLWLPFIFEALRDPAVFWQRRSTFLALFGLIVATSLLRNNGLFLALATVVVCILIFRKHATRKLIIVSLAAVLVALVPSTVVSLLGNQPLFREAVGVPLQQLGAVVVTDPESLTTAQKRFLEGMLPLESYERAYAPMDVDTIKYNKDFNTYYLQYRTKEFFETYLALGLSHPDTYARSYLSLTHGYWSLVEPNTMQSYFFEISENIKQTGGLQAMAEWDLYNDSLYPEAFAKSFDATYQQVVWAPSGGLCFLLVLLGVFVLSIKQRSALWLVVALPSIALWCTLMIASPISSSLRYFFPFVVLIPFLVGALFTRRNQQTANPPRR